MRTAQPRTGVCVLRIEKHDDEILITLRINPDIEHVSVEEVHRSVDIETTMQAVRAFLVAFIAGSSAPSDS